MSGHLNPTRDAAAILIRAYEHATRLGHPYLAGEHFLLALTAAAQPAGAVLREHGVTPGRTEAEIVRLSGAGLFGDLDRDALAAVGIDLDAVRATAEASFGPAALTRAARTAHRDWGPLGRLRPRTGASRNGVFLPHGPGANQALDDARAGARAAGCSETGVEHLALAILAVSDGLVPPVLARLGSSGPGLRAAVRARYRAAG